MTTGDGLSAQRHLIEDLDGEPHLTAEIGKHLHIAGSFVSEVEVVAFMDFTHAQILFQDFFRKLAWGKQGKIAPEG